MTGVNDPSVGCERVSNAADGSSMQSKVTSRLAARNTSVITFSLAVSVECLGYYCEQIEHSNVDARKTRPTDDIQVFLQHWQ